MKNDITITATPAVHAVKPVAGRVEDEPQLPNQVSEIAVVHTWTTGEKQVAGPYSTPVLAEAIGRELAIRYNAHSKLLRDNAALKAAAKRVLAMHDDAMFICGSDDTGIVHRNISALRTAISQAEAAL